MAHYAILDKDNIVIQVIVGKDDDSMDWEAYYGGKKTSYNTKGGIYYNSDGTIAQDQSKAFRKNFANIGYYYDEELDAFIPPRPPYINCEFDSDKCVWFCELTEDEINKF
jgi:hypothetical protein